MRRSLLAFFVVMASLWPTLGAAQNPNPNRERIMKEMREAQRKAPRAGDAAPDFKLKTMDETQEESLAELRASKPVILLFGSYT